MAFSLAELFVTFTVKGVESVQKALDAVHRSLKSVQKGMQSVGTAATYAFGIASAALGGLIRQGIAASSVGQVLSFHFEQLARIIAGLFRPEIEAIIDGIKRLNTFLRSLTDAQRENIVAFTKATAAGLGLAIVLPRVVGALAGVVNGVRAVTVALGILTRTSGPLLVVIGAIAAAFGAMAVGSEVAENGLGGIIEALKPMLESLLKFATQLIEALKPVYDVAMRVFTAIWEAIKPVLPVLMDMVTLIGGALANAFIELEPAITAMVEALGGILQALAPLVPIFTELVVTLIQALTPVLQIVAVLITALAKLLTPVIQLFVKLANVLLTILKPALDAIAWLLNKVARALAWLFGVDLDKQTKAMEKIEKAPGKPGRGELPMKVGGWEGIDEAYKRIAMASIKMSVGEKGVDVQQLDELRGIGVGVKNVEQAVRNQRPAFGGPNLMGNVKPGGG